MGDDAAFMNTINERQQVVNHFIASKKKLEALKASLQDPPVASKSQSVKNANGACVQTAINAFTDLELTQMVEKLDDDESDVLMKYVYKFMNDGMQQGGSYAAMLRLHALLVKKCGIGSIVRVMSDRKTV